MRTTIQIAMLVALGLVGPACSKAATGYQLPQRSFSQFQSEVYPVLLRDCAFSTCHGSPQRFFRIWGPGRARIDPTSLEFDRLTADEAATNLQLALSMIDAANPSQSLLLRKPLAVEAGGSAHRGADKFGRNVYRTVNDAGYLAISRWVFAATASAATTGSGN
jgi:hypothetical protein